MKPARDLAARRARAEALAEPPGAARTPPRRCSPTRPGFGGVVGSFAARLPVADGYEVAIAAALGAAAEAVAVDGLDAAAEILATPAPRRRRHGAGLVIAQATPTLQRPTHLSLRRDPYTRPFQPPGGPTAPRPANELADARARTGWPAPAARPPSFSAT